MKKLIFLLALLFGLTTSANAIMFDPLGLGDPTSASLIEVAQWDWSPSSAVSIGANGLNVGDSFTLLTHGSAGTLKDSNFQTVWSDFGLSYEITFVAGFRETVVNSTYDAATNTSTQNFVVSAGAPNFFKVYIDDKSTGIVSDSSLAGDASAGTGFYGGTLLFEGTVFSGGGNFSAEFNKIGLLDQAGTDGASGAAFGNTPQNTVAGTGGTTLQTSVGFSNFNMNYFPLIDNTAILWMLFSDSTSNNLPFKQVDPSNNFFDGTLTGGNPNYYNPDLGPVNAAPFYIDGNGNQVSQAGKDVIFQSDASTSEIGIVPEPGTLLLLGFGLLGFAGVARRKHL